MDTNFVSTDEKLYMVLSVKETEDIVAGWSSDEYKTVKVFLSREEAVESIRKTISPSRWYITYQLDDNKKMIRIKDSNATIDFSRPIYCLGFHNNMLDIRLEEIDQTEIASGVVNKLTHE